MGEEKAKINHIPSWKAESHGLQVKTQEGGDVLLNDDCVEFPKTATDFLFKKSKAKFIKEKNDVLHCFLKIILKSVEFRKKIYTQVCICRHTDNFWRYTLGNGKWFLL